MNLFDGAMRILARKPHHAVIFGIACGWFSVAGITQVWRFFGLGFSYGFFPYAEYLDLVYAAALFLFMILFLSIDAEHVAKDNL